MADIWYLLFMDSDREFWLKPFLKIGFHHVVAIKPDRFHYLIVENHYRNCSTYSLKSIDGLLSKTNQIVKVREVEARRGLLMLDTCVGTTKQMLGIRKPFIWTPWQLYKHAKRLRDEQEKRQNDSKNAARASV